LGKKGDGRENWGGQKTQVGTYRKGNSTGTHRESFKNKGLRGGDWGSNLINYPQVVGGKPVGGLLMVGNFSNTGKVILMPNNTQGSQGKS